MTHNVYLANSLMSVCEKDIACKPTKLSPQRLRFNWLHTLDCVTFMQTPYKQSSHNDTLFKTFFFSISHPRPVSGRPPSSALQQAP